MSELYEKSLRKLELDQVLALLAECAGSEGGKEGENCIFHMVCCCPWAECDGWMVFGSKIITFLRYVLALFCPFVVQLP